MSKRIRRAAACARLSGDKDGEAPEKQRTMGRRTIRDVAAAVAAGAGVVLAVGLLLPAAAGSARRDAIGGKVTNVSLPPVTAYVANSWSWSVTPIAVATNTPGTPIPVGNQATSAGSGPDSVAITPDGKTAYVTSFGNGSVTPIDLATNTAGSPILVGVHPEGIAITPDGKTAYVVMVDTHSVIPINLATNTSGSSIPVGRGPDSVAITPNGKTAYVT
jgi:YVTN family beta-propeller protein